MKEKHIATISSLSFLLACGGSAPPTPPAEVLASEVVTSEGGTIEVPSLDLTLTIPEGSLDSDTTITLSESIRTGPDGTIGTVIQIEPEDLTFDPPLELSYAIDEDDLEDGAYPERLVIMTYEDDEWVRVGNEITDYDPDNGTFSIMAYVEHFSDWAIRDTGLTGTLYGIYGTDLSALTAAGEGGLVDYSSGATTTETTANETWRDYYADGVTEYIVGVDATRTPRIRTRPVSGGSWTNATLPANAAGRNPALNGIHGEGSTVIAVGFLGRILSWDGSAWQDESTGASHLYDVHVLGGGAAIAVGAGATALIRSGTTWTADAIPANLAARLTLRGVWGTSTTDYYAVGSSGRDGVILHRTASGWALERTETRQPLYGVAGSTMNTHIVGAGVFLRRGANGSYTEDSLVDGDCAPTNQSVTLYDLFVDANDSFVAVGSNGQIVTNVPCGSDMDAGMPMTDAGDGTDAGASDSGALPPGSCGAMGITLDDLDFVAIDNANDIPCGEDVAYAPYEVNDGPRDDFSVIACGSNATGNLTMCDGAETFCAVYNSSVFIQIHSGSQVRVIPRFSDCTMTYFDVEVNHGTPVVRAYASGGSEITLTSTTVSATVTRYTLAGGMVPVLITINGFDIGLKTFTPY